MNIVLIHGFIRAKSKDTYLSEPLGLICLASWLDKQFQGEVKSSILDLYAEGAIDSPSFKDGLFCFGKNDPEFIRSELEKRKPQLIGIHSNFTAYVQDAFELAQIVKKFFPDVPIIIGGAHPTIEAKEVLQQCPSIDFVAKGEGEKILENLIRHLRGEIKIDQVDGLVYRQGGEIIFNRPIELIADLDELPIPNREYIDLKKYSYFNKQAIWYAKQSPIATIMTSRGCPYRCTFCSTKVVWTRKWRYRSLENVFAEIRILVENYGVKEIVINDDQFMTRKERIHEFCDYFIREKIGVSFAVDSGISIWLVNEELLRKMKKAGFYSLRFPIESGSKKTLEYIDKPVDLDKAKVMIDYANSIGFWTSSNIIIGFPYETRAEIEESIQYVFDSSLDFTSFIVAKPHAGSEMYETFKKEGLLEKKLIRGSGFYESHYDTIHLTAREIQELAVNASARWLPHKIGSYLNPFYFYKFFLPKLSSWNSFTYFLRICFVVFSKKVVPSLLAKVRFEAFQPPERPASRQI